MKASFAMQYFGIQIIKFFIFTYYLLYKYISKGKFKENCILKQFQLEILFS